jgi:xanthine dehydrogenase YagR molybdenum-binding subunit
MGQGLRTAVALVAAEDLGLEPDRIRILMGDTIAPPQHVTAGSWGAISATPPLHEAARNVRAQLLKLATSQAGSPLHALTADALTLRNGRVESKDGRSAQCADVFRRAGISSLDSEAQWYAPGEKPDVIEKAKQGLVSLRGPTFPDFVAFSYVAHFVEVRINPRIPRPRVARVVSVVDCGRVLSKRTARSQVYGGIVWGIGAALSEESAVDPRFGGFLNCNLADY